MVYEVLWEDAASFRSGDSSKTKVGECLQTTIGVLDNKSLISKNGSKWIRVFQNWDNWEAQDWTEIPVRNILGKPKPIGPLPT